MYTYIYIYIYIHTHMYIHNKLYVNALLSPPVAGTQSGIEGLRLKQGTVKATGHAAYYRRYETCRLSKAKSM